MHHTEIANLDSNPRLDNDKFEDKMSEVVISDDELADAVRSQLESTWDLDSVTLNSLRVALEEKFGCDLNERKQTLKQILREYVESMQETAEEAAASQVKELEAAKQEEDEEDVDDNDDGPTGEGESRSKRKRGKPKSSGKKTGEGGGKGGGFSAPVLLSAELAEFLGEESMPRTAVTKRIWAYIKENKLQNTAPKKGREILCDDKLSKVLKCKKIDMMKMTSVLAKQMLSAKDLQARADAADASDDDESEDEEGDDSGDEDEEAAGEARSRKLAKASLERNKATGWGSTPAQQKKAQKAIKKESRKVAKIVRKADPNRK
ncbi:hypothetical protein EBZ37_14530, partial [bacterium]|nr:hypothetical protein [bacterium]